MYKNYIEDPNRRNVTLCKRKSMLLRKTIELSNMCAQDIFLCIFDKEKQKILEFRTSDSFDVHTVQDLLRQETKCQFQQELFTKTSGHLNNISKKEDPVVDDDSDESADVQKQKKISMTTIKNDFKKELESKSNISKDILLGIN